MKKMSHVAIVLIVVIALGAFISARTASAITPPVTIQLTNFACSPSLSATLSIAANFSTTDFTDAQTGRAYDVFGFEIRDGSNRVITPNVTVGQPVGSTSTTREVSFSAVGVNPYRVTVFDYGPPASNFPVTNTYSQSFTSPCLTTTPSTTVTPAVTPLATIIVTPQTQTIATNLVAIGGQLNGDESLPPVQVFCAQGGGVVVTIVQDIREVGRFGASPIQLAEGLGRALAGRANIQVAAGRDGTGIWVLPSSEVQVTRRLGGELNYDFIFPVNECGPITPITPVTTTTTTSTVPVTNISGANVQLVQIPAVQSGTCLAPAGATGVHIVSRGENLYRIGLRYGIDYRVIAAFNNIADPARIYAGQCIIIP